MIQPLQINLQTQPEISIHYHRIRYKYPDINLREERDLLTLCVDVDQGNACSLRDKPKHKIEVKIIDEFLLPAREMRDLNGIH